MKHKSTSKNKRKYRIRFHLAKGKHYKHWQVTNMNTKHVSYYDPNAYSIEMLNCKLGNHPTTAKKIFEGAHKTVCAWVDCEDYQMFYPDVAQKVVEYFTATSDFEQYSYNPRKQPYWVDEDKKDVDNMEINRLVTLKNRIYG